MRDSFGSVGPLTVGDTTYRIARLESLARQGFDVHRLPYSFRILLENLLRREDGVVITRADIEALASWDPKATPSREIAFMPGRVLMQDFTGIPCLVDLAAMRDAMVRFGGDPEKINPLAPAELVIDHSVQVDAAGSNAAFATNVEKEFDRNRERYAFFRWGQSAFRNLRIVPPGTGICHQVNLEYLARVVMTSTGADGTSWAHPDTVIGMDSHTTMVNGLGVLGWGVGGIEAEAALLGQPVSMLIPQVVGVRLAGRLPEGSTATDLVLRVTEMLRKKGVVGKFVEYFGPGLDGLTLADRATIANMSPEYGATIGLFPVDSATLAYLRLTGRTDEQVQLVETYLRAQGLFGMPREPAYTEVVELDLGSVETSLAGPKRPQDRVALSSVKSNFIESLAKEPRPGGAVPAKDGVPITIDGKEVRIADGSVVIAAITSCTNTSNPSVMLAAGLLAKKAVERGLTTKPWVKASLAPGSRVVTDYLAAAGLQTYLDQLRFNLVGYGCTTCIGNSGPLAPAVAKAIDENGLVAAAVLSGNRNFEGRVHPKVRANYLASPPLVVAYAIAGRVDIDLQKEPLGIGKDGKPVFLRDLWPSGKEIDAVVQRNLTGAMFRNRYKDVFTGDERWNSLPVTGGVTYRWDDTSAYVRNPPFFENMPRLPSRFTDITGARVLASLGDSITTDHISPAGPIEADSPAGRYLQEHGVPPAEFNAYGTRRGDHEVLMRGTFANPRLKNQLVLGVEGGQTLHFPEGTRMSIFDAAVKYQAEGVPLIILAGKEYGSGSSRDWAAKGPRLLDVRAVIAESFERIHRSNLVGMGIVPLEFLPGQSVASLGLTGRETFDVVGLSSGMEAGFAQGRELEVVAQGEGRKETRFRVKVRVDTPQEVLYERHGGILQYVLRQLVAGTGTA